MLLRIYKAIRQPRRALGVIAAQVAGRTVWSARYEALRAPKLVGTVPHDPGKQRAILADLEASGFAVQQFDVDPRDYREYLARARYRRFATYYEGGRSPDFHEKGLEHYLAARLLDLRPDDVYIDVASFDSPAPQIYRDLFRCTVYRQDMVYAEGVRGDRIGGDAARMPVPDGFATRIALHNSFEHFEGDSDIAFIREAGRVLRPGGRLCIVPLFLFDVYAIQTDPAVLPRGGLRFDDGAILYCARGWRDRHGRFYDVPHLVSRIRRNLRSLRMTIHVVRNERDVDPGCYVKFIGVFEKA